MIPQIKTNEIVSLPTKAEWMAYWDTQNNFNKINKKGLAVGKVVIFFQDEVTITNIAEDGKVLAVDANGIERRYLPTNLKLKK